MFDAVAEFLWMGGYAFFVWSAYAVTLLVLLANLWLARHNRRRIVERLQRQLGLQPPAQTPHDKEFKN